MVTLPHPPYFESSLMSVACFKQESWNSTAYHSWQYWHTACGVAISNVIAFLIGVRE